MADIAGRSTLSTASTDSVISHVLQPPPTAAEASQSLACTTLLPHQHYCSKQSTGTFTAIPEFDGYYGSTARWQPSRIATFPNVPGHYSAQFPCALSQPVLVHHQLEYYHCPGPPPMQRLPSLPIPNEKVEAREYLFTTAESDEESSDTGMVPATPELPVDGLHGFPYCMGISDAMEQRSRALAEAEESTYHKTMISRQSARLRGWIRCALTDVSVDDSPRRYQSCLR
jgi:hypothetical protein